MEKDSNWEGEVRTPNFKLQSKPREGEARGRGSERREAEGGRGERRGGRERREGASGERKKESERLGFQNAVLTENGKKFLFILMF